jgi:hypothetical protein
MTIATIHAKREGMLFVNLVKRNSKIGPTPNNIIKILNGGTSFLKLQLYILPKKALFSVFIVYLVVDNRNSELHQ